MFLMDSFMRLLSCSSSLLRSSSIFRLRFCRCSTPCLSASNFLNSASSLAACCATLDTFISFLLRSCSCRFYACRIIVKMMPSLNRRVMSLLLWYLSSISKRRLSLLMSRALASISKSSCCCRVCSLACCTCSPSSVFCLSCARLSRSLCTLL